MKLQTLIPLAGLLATLSIACNKTETPLQETSVQEKSCGTITLRLKEEDAPTKASAYTTTLDYEKKISSVQIFVFDASTGKIDMYRNVGTDMSATLSMTEGEKKVWAVINGPELPEVATENELKDSGLYLGLNSRTTGLVMLGSKSCTVISGVNSDCTMTVRRPVARVALTSIKNELPEAYGALKIKNVCLTNVVGSQNIGMNEASNTWYNTQGREAGNPQIASHIIDGVNYMADEPEMTFNMINSDIESKSSLTPSTPYTFYTFPNKETYVPDNFSPSFVPQRSALVITAVVDGNTYYYPILLNKSTLDANTSYTVAATITGKGSSDPVTPVEKGGIDVTLTIVAWGSGAVYDEVI